MVRQKIAQVLRRRGVQAFLKQLPSSSIILDVGCGNNSPRRIKSILPDSHYVGIDVVDYNQSTGSLDLADEYLVCEPDDFAQTIDSLGQRFEGVISSHNLEHCNDRDATLRAMAKNLKPSGLMFLSFPCAQSTSFPRRDGTLNYFDDETHQFEPPKMDEVISVLRSENMEIAYSAEQYRPFLLSLIGLLLEPLSAFRKHVYPGTWAYHGFEAIIWAKKRAG
jgi:2-polyprenyl-3-methyl-5-hydroxy-6-metoxy-1,4-benzoquinol methylase